MSRHRKQDERDDALSRDVYEVLNADGRIVPQTEADIASAEAATAEASIELPAELRDAKKVFQRPATDGEPKVIGLSTEPGLDTSLRRAAREGGHLTPEVEQRMQEDRRRAQQEQDDADNGPDAG